MSDVFSLDPRGQQALEDEARSNPLDPQALPLPMWEGVGSQFKQLVAVSDETWADRFAPQEHHDGDGHSR